MSWCELIPLLGGEQVIVVDDALIDGLQHDVLATDLLGQLADARVRVVTGVEDQSRAEPAGRLAAVTQGVGRVADEGELLPKPNDIGEERLTA
jgi:hypothetical protein